MFSFQWPQVKVNSCICQEWLCYCQKLPWAVKSWFCSNQESQSANKCRLWMEDRNTCVFYVLMADCEWKTETHVCFACLWHCFHDLCMSWFVGPSIVNYWLSINASWSELQTTVTFLQVVIKYLIQSLLAAFISASRKFWFSFPQTLSDQCW